MGLAASQPFLFFFFTTQFTTVVKSALQAIRERGLRTFLRELKDDGFTKCFFDGNLLVILLPIEVAYLIASSTHS
ncbi:hypothetical protein ES288_D04G073300v1 [Gossypium darwinii]|uniref:Uncharacterized protein n=1 Tax=Gossypium darwinii TaxID=34276 RepID=A0A5D2CU61_GOSDA|nr:hypothetical protein ES288_D04G073300v1 [Gossypium darwinii]